MEYLLVFLLSAVMFHYSKVPEVEYRETKAKIYIERHPVTKEIIMEVKE